MWTKLKAYQPYLWIALVAGLLISPQLVHHVAIIGIDSVFHMNRFYDTAMQLKTGHLSYFQSWFGFMGSGRVVNPLYGALFAYLNGLLLIIMHSWVNYQLASSFLILMLSGSLAYHMALRFGVSRWASWIVGVMYMTSTPILGWVVGQQFTGWGAALLPLLLVNAADLIVGQVRPVRLAVGIVILFQVHTLSCLIGSMALLPFWLSGFLVHPSQRKPMLLRSIGAFFLTVLLSANAWGGMLEVMTSNHLLPVAPATPLSDDSIQLITNNDSIRLNPVSTVLFALLILYLVFFWKQIKMDLKIVSLTSLLFLFLSSSLFPWDFMGRRLPFLNFYLQMPKRLDVVAYLLLALSIGMILRDPTTFTEFNRWRNWIAGLFLVPALLLFLGTVQSGTNAWYSNEAVQNDYNLNFHIHHVEQLRQDMLSNNPKTALYDITKSTPDYLPVAHNLGSKEYYPFRPYSTYTKDIINNPLNVNHVAAQVQKKVTAQGMQFSWVNNTNQSIVTAVPLIKYRHSQITFNGKKLTSVSTSKIGRLIVMAKPGRNVITMHYQSSWWFKVLIWIAILSWGTIIGFRIWKFKKD